MFFKLLFSTAGLCVHCPLWRARPKRIVISLTGQGDEALGPSAEVAAFDVTKTAFLAPETFTLSSHLTE